MDPTVEPEEKDDSPTLPCRFCGELVRATAKKCRFCGEWLDESMRDVVRARGKDPAIDAPVLLKVWGALTMGFSVLVGGLQIVQGLYFMFAYGGSGMLLGMSVGLMISLVSLIIFARLGWGLWRGQRMAVVGYALFGGLLFLLMGAMMLGGRSSEIVVFLTVCAVAYLPPVITGIVTWKRLT